ncbi:hexameric tyrosine-coordinated heme protein [Aureisphaera galaxeae]|uniref:hexameric tyrosine-coordinated heme protein n=1 Tax=Aureisphaera galaxeae TaxID=1538023 RepID=UPI00234FDBC7|nr:hexameric tyrosine-coordinated heme protein [Aureisphaera galaxeae]MDC8003679.1 hexameric tyrosine-coordinated heme protein [Aureisphaera galaxeae]
MSDSIELIPGNSLLTYSPEAGRALAIKMARLSIKVTQPDATVREKLRPDYANDADMLISIAHVIAAEFATIAQANNYWR